MLSRNRLTQNSPIAEITKFGQGTWDDTRRGADLQFHGTLNVILALHWLKLRLVDDEGCGHTADHDGDFGRAADRIGVKRSYAYLLEKLYSHVPELQRWGAMQKQEHGQYPSPWAMLHHCGVGLDRPRPRGGKLINRDKFVERMQREIERLRLALSESEAHELKLRGELAERHGEVANLRAQLLADDGKPEREVGNTDSHSGPTTHLAGHARGTSRPDQPMDVRFSQWCWERRRDMSQQPDVLGLREFYDPPLHS